jgi:Lrp/AsnC family transcriptional regulator of ectoine degradation
VRLFGEDRRLGSGALAVAEYDILDLKIIDVLQRKGRISSALIGEAVGLSETACYNRLKRIEASGAIDHYSAQLSIKRILPLQIFFTSVWLEEDRPTDLNAFEQMVVKVPEIIECHYITGSIDYLLKCVARDFDAYVEIMNGFRDSNPNIKRWETSAQVREVKMSAVPLELIGRARAASA